MPLLVRNTNLNQNISAVFFCVCVFFFNINATQEQVKEEKKGRLKSKKFL